MNAPLVSIVTPSLNPGLERFHRCVESVRAQTYERIEHIVVDGGSTDGVRDALDSYPHLRSLCEPDEGQSDAINKGFMMADGTILGWLNADDVLTREAIAKVVVAFGASSAGWSIGNVVVVRDGRGELEIPSRIDRPGSWATRTVAPQPGSFVTRHALDQVGALDTSFQYTMDLDLWLRLIDADLEHVYIDEVLAVFEVHPGSKSGSVSHGDFLVEDSKARLKSGRDSQAAFSLGRAGAWNFLGKEVPLEDALAWAVTKAAVDPKLLDEATFEGGYRLERSILMAKTDLSALPRLVDPRHLFLPESRARLKDVLTRGATRPRRRRMGQRYAAMLVRP